MWEAGASLGGMNCLTDIGGTSGVGKKFIKDINWSQIKFCAAFFASTTWQSKLALRLEATAGQIEGSDAVLKNSTDMARNRYLRNLRFKTSILELAITGELHVVTILYNNADLPLFSPYLVAGIGVFKYNPQAPLNNRWVDLRPLHTEGQAFKEYPERRSYSSASWCLPAGLGIKYDRAGAINLRLEILYRITGTDYLDDVSNRYINPALFSKYLSPPNAAMANMLADRSAELSSGVKNNKDAIRGNPANKDAYFSCSFKISLALARIQGK